MTITTQTAAAEIFEDIRQINGTSPRRPTLPAAFKRKAIEHLDENGNVMLSPPPVSPPPSIGGSCFPAGTRVLMADGSTKNMEDIKPGDLMMTIGGEAVECLIMETPVLGNRKMIEFEDKSFMWSDEHLFWTRKVDTKEQWWWSFNPETWRGEVEAGVVVGLYDNDSLFTGENVEYATVDGWKSVKAQETAEEYDFYTQLYLPKTDGRPIIVNGYLVTGGTNEWTYDYTQINWTKLTQPALAV